MPRATDAPAATPAPGAGLGRGGTLGSRGAGEFPRGLRVLAVAASLLLVRGLHGLLPVEPGGWHALHLAVDRLYYAPILLAASWLPLPGALATALAAGFLSAQQAFAAWSARPMVRADHMAGTATFLLVAGIAATLFGRDRRARCEVERAHTETLTGLASSLELREEQTAGHSRRVEGYALRLAAALGRSSPRFLASLAAGALLHDIGKIGLPDRILLKPGPLSTEERRRVNEHPGRGAALLSRIASLREAAALVLSHHERWDGTGYPGGLAGEAIPLGARIFAVADAFDALTSRRPYHEPVSYDEALRLIANGRARAFDPAVVDAFLSIPFGDLAAVAAENGLELARGENPPRATRRTLPTTG